jgi:hypothetical protein
VEFRFPSELLYPLVVSVAFPLTLFCIALHPGLRANNAARFFAATLFQTVLWALGSLALPGELRPQSLSDWVLGALIWTSFMLLYLEVWALLSRGYTLAMLLVLLKSATPLSTAEIARDYRGGAGLGWIMKHRAGGLEAAGLITKQSGDIALTPLGALVARGYAAARSVLGLRSSG